MALLTDPQRVVCWTEVQRNLATLGVTTGGTKAQWRTMIDALDDFLEANAAAINSAIPQPERGTFSQKEKALALMFVIQNRYVTS